MLFPHNRVILSALADVDFLATLALTDVSASLYHLILDHVITRITLSHFLREHQYVFHHDNFNRLFSNKEVLLVYRAFEAIRNRHDEFYDDVKTFLGPFLARIWMLPHKILEKPLPSDFQISTPTNTRYPELYCIESIRWEYNIRLCTSWMHYRTYLQAGFFHREPFDLIHGENPNPFLREEVLYSKRYVDDLERCLPIAETMSRFRRAKKINLPEITTQIHQICAEKNLCLSLEKRCVQAALEKDLPETFHVRQRVSCEDFLALFELPRWKNLWSTSELGYWCAVGLSQYGHTRLRELIATSFSTKCNALIWLFLGAHHFYRGTAIRQPDVNASKYICCRWHAVGEGFEQQYLQELIASISLSERVWVIKEIIRLAPEFGICRDLAANLFNYFVLHDKSQADFMFAILLNEIIDTRLQYLFEYAISVAIVDYYGSNGVECLEFKSAREYCPKLLRQDQYLYKLLTCSKLDSFISMCKELVHVEEDEEES